MHYIMCPDAIMRLALEASVVVSSWSIIGVCDSSFGQGGDGYLPIQTGALDLGVLPAISLLQRPGTPVKESRGAISLKVAARGHRATEKPNPRSSRPCPVCTVRHLRRINSPASRGEPLQHIRTVSTPASIRQMDGIGSAMRCRMHAQRLPRLKNLNAPAMVNGSRISGRSFLSSNGSHSP